MILKKGWASMSSGMMRNKVFFVGSLHAASVTIFSYFKENWEVVNKIHDLSEVGEMQAGQKSILIFSDVKKALEFLEGNELQGEVFLGLIAQKEGKYKDHVMEIFQTHHLHFYTPKTTHQLIEDANQFLLGGLITSEELEFSVQLELAKT